MLGHSNIINCLYEKAETNYGELILENIFYKTAPLSNMVTHFAD